MTNKEIKKAAQEIAKKMYDYPERIGSTNWNIGIHSDGSTEWNHNSWTQGGDYFLDMYGIEELCGDYDADTGKIVFDGDPVTTEELAEVVLYILPIIIQEQEIENEEIENKDKLNKGC